MANVKKNPINYKNRSVLMATGISDDGQANASVSYDRFDKMTYVIELDGELVKMDGTTYTPTPIPDTQTIVDAKMVTNQGGGALGKVRITFQYPVPVTDLVVENFKFFGDGSELPIYSLEIRDSGENWNYQHTNNTVIELILTDSTYNLPLGVIYSVEASVGNGTGLTYKVNGSDDILLNTQFDEVNSLFYDTVQDTYYLEPCWWGEYDIYERTATNPPE